MGTWGAGLYADDSAADLKNTIALLSKVPMSGDRLLEILLEGADDEPAFWLVVADQFERKGIACEKAFTRARDIVATGADLRDLEARGMDARTLTRRAAVLKELDERLRDPRPARPSPKAGAAPGFVVDAGEVYSFPTMRGTGFNAWYATWEEAKFTPDGWGAMLVVAKGRVFDWLPWCAVAALAVDPAREPTLEDCARARFRLEEGAEIVVPRAQHLKRMHMRLLGRLSLDPKKAAAAVTTVHTAQYAVRCGWSFIAVAMGRKDGFEGGQVADLLAT